MSPARDERRQASYPRGPAWTQISPGVWTRQPIDEAKARALMEERLAERDYTS